MRRRPWGIMLLVLGGVGVGVAVAGVPSRGQDPPLQVDTGADRTTTSTTLFPVTTTTAPTTTTTEAATTSTAARRRP